MIKLLKLSFIFTVFVRLQFILNVITRRVCCITLRININSFCRVIGMCAHLFEPKSRPMRSVMHCCGAD